MLLLRGFLLAPGQPAEQPDGDADRYAHKNDPGDQEHQADRDPDQREKQHEQGFPDQESDDPRGGNAEDGFQKPRLL